MERFLRHEHFAPHFNRDRFLQLQWDRPHGPEIDGDVFPDTAVAARRPLDKAAVFIMECNGKAVDFQLADILDVVACPVPDALVELADILFIEHVR